MTGLRLIGYWRNAKHPEYPDPHDLVDAAWDEDERHVTGSYLASGTVAWAFMGYSPCRFCGENNGDLEYTDGVYVWPSGLAHYIDEHHVRLPQAIVDHASDRLTEVEKVRPDLAWWLAETRA